MCADGNKTLTQSLFPNTVELNSGLIVRQLVLNEYWLDFHEGSSDLVITFENAGDGVGDGQTRDFWGLNFLVKRGYSVLGVKWRIKNWYRGTSLSDFFRSAQFKCLIAKFNRTIFMGGSMGGYAALAFSSAAPGAIVLAHNPQSTLDQRLVPWDKRFPQATPLNWDGEFGDAARECGSAKRVFITYDPYDRLDRRHVDRLSGDNIVRLHVPFVGHAVPVWLKDMNVLSEVTELALSEELTPLAFAKLVRVRRHLPRYYIRLLKHARSRKIKDFIVETALANTRVDAALLCVVVKHLFDTENLERCVELYEVHKDYLLSDETPSIGIVRALTGRAMLKLNGNRGIIDRLCSLANFHSKSSIELSETAMLLLEADNIQAAYELAQNSTALRSKTRLCYKVKAICELRLGRTNEAANTLAEGLNLFGRGDGLLKLQRSVRVKREHLLADDVSSFRIAVACRL